MATKQNPPKEGKKRELQTREENSLDFGPCVPAASTPADTFEVCFKVWTLRPAALYVRELLKW